MPFDPTLPANNSPIVSAELRNQFNALKTLIDAKASGIPDVTADGISISDPPTYDEIQNLADKVTELINALKAGG